ncbi:MAG: cyclic nucleotide-binding protein [Hyphomicrobium sp.]|nr:cyclic nucleotide-binding protein [Hyphomicrobium sp.]PPC84052.1 MAG: cyclic nucleotide-binding protein [Hyphomicrobium sp.]
MTHGTPNERPSQDLSDANPAPMSWIKRARRRTYEVVELGHGEDRASHIFDSALVLLICLNIAAFVAESVPRLRAAYGAEFHAFELFSVVVFTIEYLARLWIAVEVPYLKRLSALSARWRFARRPAQLIDLAAVLPFYLGQMFAIDLRVLRVLRLLRLLKLSRYSPAMHTLIRVISNEQRALSGAALLLAAAVLFASTGIHYLEAEAQPDKFGSIPEAAWWAVATLTTVGYGDVTPQTPLGKLFGAIVMVIGLCILALPVAIISTGFAQEANRRDFVVNWSMMSKIPLLAELDARDAATVLPLFHAHNLPPNVEVIAEGAAGNAIYFIASGHVRRRNAASVHSYRSGEVFGGIGMLEGDQHTATYLTAGRCRLLKLYKEDFKRLELIAPEVAGRIRAAVARHHVSVIVEDHPGGSKQQA